VSRLAKQLLVLAAGVVFVVVMFFVIIRLTTNAMYEITENGRNQLDSLKDKNGK
jgi:hypothetical protein